MPWHLFVQLQQDLCWGVGFGVGFGVTWRLLQARDRYRARD